MLAQLKAEKEKAAAIPKEERSKEVRSAEPEKRLPSDWTPLKARPQTLAQRLAKARAERR